MNLAELSQKSPSEEEVYQALRRSLQRRKGFGLVFVQCSPATATRLIARVKSDISQKKIAVLSLTEEIDNLYNLVEARPDKDELNILIIQGLEKSLEPYITPGYGGEGDYYTLSNLPPILGHLNQRRDGFLDRFPRLCFVFVLPLFAIKYLIQRSPDFFDWGGGIFEIPSNSELIEQESLRIVQEADYNEYLNWTQPERDRKIAEIQCWIGEPNQTSERKAQLFFKQGNLFYASDVYEAAISSYDQAIEYEPGLPEAWFMRGIALGNLERYEEAIASYDQALKHKPDSDTVWYNRGIAFGNLERYEEAIISYDHALKVSPDDDSTWHKRGLAFANLGKYHEEIDSYNQALAINPNNSSALNSRGYALFELDRCQEAIADFDQAIRLNPNSDTSWSNRGATCSRLKRFDEAFASFEQALRLNPKNNNVWYDQGCALSKLKRYEEAINSYDRALDIKPKDYQAWCNRGTALFYLQRHEEAIASFDQALRYKPDDHEALHNKACCYALQGQAELAIVTLKQAIDLDPKYREMAKTDADFDRIRGDDRFQALIQEQVE